MRLGFVTVLAALACLPFTAGAQPVTATPVVETQSAYLVRCRAEVVAAYARTPRAQADSICQSRWDMIVASGPMATALLTAAPAPGAPFNGAGAPRRAGPVTVTVTRAPPGLTLSWFANGEPIPFDLEGALRVRGATLAMIGCVQTGVGEYTRVNRVTPPGKAPFVLTVASREAAVASQSSSFDASADFSGRAPTLAALRRDGNDWASTCPQ